MPLATVFNRTLEIRRAAPVSPVVVDDWNQPERTGDTVVATVPGMVEPMSDRELALLTDAGAQIGDLIARLDSRYVDPSGKSAPMDVQESDRLRDVASGAVYEIRSLVDAAGRSHHFKLLLRRVVD